MIVLHLHPIITLIAHLSLTENCLDNFQTTFFFALEFLDNFFRLTLNMHCLFYSILNQMKKKDHFNPFRDRKTSTELPMCYLNIDMKIKNDIQTKMKLTL